MCNYFKSISNGGLESTYAIGIFRSRMKVKIFTACENMPILEDDEIPFDYGTSYE